MEGGFMLQIDFVIPWVDGSDLEWLEERNRHDPVKNSDTRNIRYRDWDNLQYWFRGVEKFAPWVRKIFFITWGHIPEWLDVSNPKLEIVNHKDYLPQEYLPTFNTNTIELNLHRIEGLSDHFVYFNDDTFIIREMNTKDFFHKGLPCDVAALESFSSTDAFSYMIYNNMYVINKHFNKHEDIKKNFFKWFNLKYGKDLYKTVALYPWNNYSGLVSPHLPIPYQKKTFNEVWAKEYNILNNTSMRKFRNSGDVTGWLFRYWRIVKGEFHPINLSFGKYYDINNDEQAVRLSSSIIKRKHKMICINDSDEIETDKFEEIKNIISDAFGIILSEKSTFEI